MKLTLTSKLILINVIVYLFEFVFPLIDYFSFVPAHAFSEPWTFITSMFLHDDTSPAHIVLNMFALLMFGSYLEAKISKKKYLSIYFLAGIVGNLGYMLTAPSAITPGIGASGAIYGILGALAILSPTTMIFVGGVPMPMIAAAFLWGLIEFFGVIVPRGNIASGAHLGGLFVGMLFAYFMRRKS
jgi:hypothetical protein